MSHRRFRFSLAVGLVTCIVVLALGYRHFMLYREAEDLTRDGAYLGRQEVWLSVPRGAGIKFRQLPNGKLVNGSKEYGVNDAIGHAEDLSSRLKAFGVREVVVFYEDGKGRLKELESSGQLADFSHEASDSISR